MSEKKPCPVDRGKLLISLEICNEKFRDCAGCLYRKKNGSRICLSDMNRDALAYICWLEEQNDGV